MCVRKAAIFNNSKLIAFFDRLRQCCETFLPRGTGAGNADQQLAVVQQRQPGLPLRVGKRWPFRAKKLT
jgi:hypothetical protein